MIGSVLLSIFATTSFHPTEAVQSIPIVLDFAFDSDKSRWGLMQRRSIPADYGMLFLNPTGSKMHLWAFNCYIDLAVAFLDNRGTIQEISYLKAYPEMMDPKRPVYGLNDLHLYPNDDPILKFYWAHAVHSKEPSFYALETSKNFFKENRLKIGDVLQWDVSNSRAFFLRYSRLNF